MKHKPKTPKEIIVQIQELLTELNESINSPNDTDMRAAPVKTEQYSGASGGIELLLKEAFFSTPKTLSEVTSRLRQEGFNYASTVFSVALLRKVRSRSLVRLPSPGSGNEKWAYAERK